MGARYTGLGSPAPKTSLEASCNGDVTVLLLQVPSPRHSWLEARLGMGKARYGPMSLQFVEGTTLPSCVRRVCPSFWRLYPQNLLRFLEEKV
jgi:hypothetical protein